MASKPSLRELRQAFETITSEYNADFAGKPRATRDITKIEGLIHRLDDLVIDCQKSLNGSRNPAVISLLDNVRQTLDLYREEREAIVAAKSEGPHNEQAAVLATRANFVFDMYFRHYAGSSRATRDLGRLEEMISDLEVLEAEMEALQAEEDLEAIERDREVVQRNLTMYRGELDEIARARRSGTPSEQSSALANVANEQFAIYRAQFAGKSRLTRRPDLLRRMIENLERVGDHMRELERGGLDSDQNRNNIKIVHDTLETYRQELEAIKEARANAERRSLAGSLGGAANEVMEEYRQHFAGEDRRTRDLEKLTRICDELYNIEKQMAEIAEAESIEMNDSNLDIVRENLQMYGMEYRRIHEAQQSSN
jgi:hypothetical protein